MDFRDLHNAWPKNEFPLPIMDVMINNTCGFERMSFKDDFSWYNQIKTYQMMKSKQPSKYCGDILLHCDAFLLKNAKATYQQAMIVFFSNVGEI